MEGMLGLATVLAQIDGSKNTSLEVPPLNSLPLLEGGVTQEQN